MSFPSPRVGVSDAAVRRHSHPSPQHSSVWDRILQMCRILDILEQCFCDCYSGVTLHPFDGGMEKSVRSKMLSVAGYDFGAVISDVGEWKRRV